MVTRFASSLYGIIIKQYFPSHRVEMVFYRVVAVNTRCCTYPESAFAVDHQFPDPVVMQATFGTISIVHTETAHLVVNRIIYKES